MSDVEVDENVTFADVELAAKPDPSLFASRPDPSVSSLACTVLGFIFFLVYHACSTLRANPYDSHKEFIHRNMSDGHRRLDVEILVDLYVDPCHTFAAIHTFMVRDNSSHDGTLPMMWSVQWNLQNNSMSQRTGFQFGVLEHLFWRAGAAGSNSFRALNVRVKGMHRLEVRLTMDGELRHIIGAYCESSSINPTTELWIRNCNIVFSVLIGGFLLSFAHALRFDTDSFTKIHLLLIGVIGVCCWSPLKYFFALKREDWEWELRGRVTDQIALSVFVASYKMFVILQLGLLKSSSKRPSTYLILALLLFFGLYATVDAAIACDPRTDVIASDDRTHVFCPAERIRIGCDIVYCILSLGYLCFAMTGPRSSHPQRLVLFAIVTIVIMGLTVVTNIVFSFRNIFIYTLTPKLLQRLFTATLTALTLFIFDREKTSQYVDFGHATLDDQIFEIDTMSEDDDDNDSSGEETLKI
jgi:hypothetical protein